jgi:hypothetical protein
MNLTKTAFGSWSGGRFMHFGQRLDEDRWKKLARQAYDQQKIICLTLNLVSRGRCVAFEGLR